MVRLNVRSSVMDTLAPVHEAGARQTFSRAEELQRLVSCALLGERQFYVEGEDIELRICVLAKVVDPAKVEEVAVSARRDLGLRHVPLLLLVALAERRGCGAHIQRAARVILRTPKDAMDLVALYWRDRKPGAPKLLPWSFRQAIRRQFAVWTDYQLAKYATLKDRVAVRLRDLMFLAHPMPQDTRPEWSSEPGRAALFAAIADDTVRAPDTWESQLSVPGADKRAVWEGLLGQYRLGALALVRNLRNMEQVGVDPGLVRDAMLRVKAGDVWPWQALAAAREAPAYAHDLDALMLRSAGLLPRLPGRVGIMVDVSGSMNDRLSAKGSMTRMDAAAGLAVILREAAEVPVLSTFSNDLVLFDRMARGSRLARDIVGSQANAGTRLGAALKAFLARVEPLDWLVVLTDEQSQDRVEYPAGVPVLVVNLASYQRGINTDGKLIRIHGWSGNVVRFLAAEMLGQTIAPAADDEAEVD